MKTIFIVFFLIFSSSLIFSQQVSEEWVARYNGPANGMDIATAIAISDSGSVYVTGRSRRDATYWDYATVKYSPSGVQLWVQRYNADNYDNQATAIAVDDSGNVYVTGMSIIGGQGQGYGTIKYSPSGIELWAVRYSGPVNSGMDIATAIVIDNARNVYVTGVSTGSGAGQVEAIATVKYNFDGIELWAKRYYGPLNRALPSSMAVDGFGNVYVTGRSLESGSDYDYVTIKYNLDGVEQWVSKYNGTGNGYDFARSIALDASGNIYVTGESIRTGNNRDYATVKYNSNGSQQWVQRYNGPGDLSNFATAIAIDNSSNVYVTGRSRGLSSTLEDFATIKYNSAGIEEWVSRYNGPGSGLDGAKSLALDENGNIYVTGNSLGSGTAGFDYATVKYNHEGVEQWVARYNGPGNGSDEPTAIAVATIEEHTYVFVAGMSLGNNTNQDYATIKYSQTNVQNIISEIPYEFYLYQNFPNPFNPSTKISFSVQQFSDVKLKVFDVLGREVAILINQQLQPGTYQYDFDATRYTSGVYFYRIEAGEFVQTKRMLMIK
jgi:hypothetical protein